MSLLQVFQPPSKVGLFASADGVKYDVLIVELDATTRIDSSKSAQVTRLPIQTGSLISDHMVLGEERLTIEGIVSDTPLSLVPFAAIASALEGTTQTGKPSDTARSYLDAFYSIMQPFQVATGTWFYGTSDKPFFITGLRYPKNKDTGEALEVQIDMQPITMLTIDTGKGISGATTPASTKDAGNAEGANQ